MSRSRKKNPVGGITTAKSEKFDKRIINRIIRRKSKRLIEIGDPENIVFPVKEEVMDIWDMQKDGKIRWNKKDGDWYEKAIRK